MRQALERLAVLVEQAASAGADGHREYHAGWHTCLDLRNLLVVSEAITRSALERRESRGGHFREDYPERDPACATFNVAVSRDTDGGMRVSRVAIPDMPAELRRIIEEQKQ
jgi:succinate dehydrogenase / fumarate reductase flavoprotein subunit